jgi:phenylacetate-CoA ligase
MTSFFDALETRDADVREAALMVALPAQVHSKAQRQRLQNFQGIDARAITSRATWPVASRASMVLAGQQAARRSKPVMMSLVASVRRATALLNAVSIASL